MSHTKRYRLIPLGGLAILLIGIAMIYSGGLANSSANEYLETWDGQPGSPEPFTHINQSGWDVQVHKRDHNREPGQIDPMEAQHGPGCEGPHVTHSVSTVEETAFLCRDHLMTAINASDYGVIYLTPDHLVDLSDGEAVVSFDVSTFRSSGRDWWSLTLQPFNNNHALPLEDWLPDLQGMPDDVFHIRMDGSKFYHLLRADGQEVKGTGSCTWRQYDDPEFGWLEPDKSRRDTFELRIDGTTATFSMPDYDQEICSVEIPGGLDWGQATVQIGHHSYTPWKDGHGGPNTWHWDDVNISPAVPFSMIKPDKLWYRSGETIRFDQPAPENSFLRFSAWGNVEINYGDGWQTVNALSREKLEHARSFWTPIPEGTQQVEIRMSEDEWFSGPFLAQGVSIWTQSAVDGGSPPDTPTEEPTATHEAEAPTATPTEGHGGDHGDNGENGDDDGGNRGAGSLDRMSWHGQDWYLHGANVPWVNWNCDFGCLDNGGVSSDASQQQLREVFAEARDAGLQNIRWWLFTGDPWQIQESNGAPSGIHPNVFPDLDAAIDLAEEFDLYLTLVVFGGSQPLEPWLSNSSHRAALAEVLGDELFARYKDHPHIFSWEVFNEPEWEIWNGEVQEAHVQDMVKRIADQVRAKGSGYVSVGSATIDGISMWEEANLDYYQPHWYDYMDAGDWCARCTDAGEIRERHDLDKPIVIGEFYAGRSTDALQRFQDFHDRGFAGAWAWSLFPDSTDDGMVVDLNAAADFAESIDDIGPRHQ